MNLEKSKEQYPELRVTRHAKRFAEVLAPLPEGRKGVYGLGRPWQLSATQIGIAANIRGWGSDVIDLELGNDLLVVDSLQMDKPQAVVALNRADTGTDPRTGGACLVSKYPLCGDFVPLHALLEDGTAHPHAGTGFAICTIKRFPLNANGAVAVRYLGALEGVAQTAFEIQQYSFDGKVFAVEHSDIITPEGFFAGWYLTCPPLGNGMPDGEDILTGVVGRPAGSKLGMGERRDQESGNPHMARWRRMNGVWRPIRITPVSDGADYIEPSLIRDLNGDLLYSARNWDRRPMPLISVWRSTDNGATWKPQITKDGVRSQSPVTLNQALDGTAYLASCPGQEDDFSVNARSRLNIWPLSADRSGVLAPVTARDCKAEFGEPDYCLWRVDHPVGANVRLADGAWHHLLCYRIMEEHGAPPTGTTGLYVEEVLTAQTIDPPWKFNRNHGSGKKPRTQQALLGNHQRCWIWGRHLVMDTLESGKWPVLELKLGDNLNADRLLELRNLAVRRNVPVAFATQRQITRLCRDAGHQGIAAKMPPFPYSDPAEIADDRQTNTDGPILLLDGIQDAYNFGAILRSGDVLGVRGVCIPLDGQVGVTSMTARASAGALNHVHICRIADTTAWARELRARNFQVIGASEKGDTDPRNVNWRRPTLLIMGNEGCGIRPELLEQCDALTRIPHQEGSVPSLNVAAATAILLYAAAVECGDLAPLLMPRPGAAGACTGNQKQKPKG